VFNEILTGKASLEPKPEPMAPYRELGTMPPVHHACVTCSQRYLAPAGSTASLCATCQLEIVEANARNDRLAFQLSEDQARRAARSHRWMATIIGTLVVVGLGLFRYGMRSQMREDAAIGAGYESYSEYEAERDAVYPTDEYSRQVQSMADDMCRCSDLPCARNLQRLFGQFVRSHSPTDDKADESARADSIRLADCQARIESGDTHAP